MPHTKKHFAIIIESEQIALFSYKSGLWQIEPIQQESWHKLEHIDLPKLLEKLDGKINLSSRLSGIELAIIYSKESVKQLTYVESLIVDYQCEKISILRYEPIEKIIKAQGQKINKSKDHTLWYTDLFLSRVTKTLLYSDTQREEEISKALLAKNELLEKKDLEIEAKELSKEALEAECRKLRNEIEAMQLLDNEQVLSFMPMFYRNFWNSISPSDVALLLDSVKPIEIPSPFPEPSLDTISSKKKRFKQLPIEEQERIIRFCKNLTHKLEIRQEFKSLLGDLDD